MSCIHGYTRKDKYALTARKYWNKLKQRQKEEGNETVTNCNALKLRAEDGKMRLTYWSNEEPVFDRKKLDDIDSRCAVDTVITHTSPSFCELSSHIEDVMFHMLDIMELREIPPV
jgi:hypothetical protein